LGDLLVGRSENFDRVRLETAPALAAAALAVIRLDEFSQSHTPIAAKLVNRLLVSQEADGGWADPMTTVLAIRALLCSRGNGLAIDRGLAALANLQKSDGSFPAEPIRRMPSDAFVTALVLFELFDCPAAWDAIRFEDALAWLDEAAASFDQDTQTLVDRLTIRCRSRVIKTDRQFMWS
jgi:hypothetical protein